MAPIVCLGLSEWLSIAKIIEPMLKSFQDPFPHLPLNAMKVYLVALWVLTMIAVLLKNDPCRLKMGGINGNDEVLLDETPGQVIGVALFSPFILLFASFWNTLMWGAVQPILDWNAVDYPYLWNRVVMLIMLGPFWGIGVLILFGWASFRLQISLRILNFLRKEESKEPLETAKVDL